MTVLKGKVVGLKALDKKLLALSKQYSDPKIARKVLRPVLKEVAQPILSQLKATTPVDSGALKNSIKLRVKVPSKKEQKSAKTRNPIMIALIGYTGNEIIAHGLTVEYGNRNRPALSPLRNALNNNLSYVQSNFRGALSRSINTFAKKLARKK